MTDIYAWTFLLLINSAAELTLIDNLVEGI